MCLYIHVYKVYVCSCFMVLGEWLVKLVTELMLFLFILQKEISGFIIYL